MRRVVVATFLLVSACSTGPAAPPIETGDTVCSDAFCVSVPDGWEVERGQQYLAFRHEASPGEAQATISPINMQALVESAGDSWPASTEEVVAAFWRLLGEGGLAEFERMERLTGGAFRSEGSYGNGKLWHLLIPGTGGRGVAFEVRGPNASWEIHAEAFFSSLEILE